MQKTIEQLLQTRRLRITTPRKIIFDVLLESKQPLSIVDIIDRAKSVDKVSVYRTIDLFVKEGIATTAPHGWKLRYELAAPLKPHHHHITCTNCGALQDVQHEKIERLMEALAKENGYEMTQHTFEISGLCANCRND